MLNFKAQKKSKLSKTVLKEYPFVSYSLFMKLLRNKDVKVNGVRIKEDVEINPCDEVIIYYNKPEDDGYNTLYIDDNILVVDKKKGVLSETIFENVSKKYRDVRFIHRLDRNTDGIMIFALNSVAESYLLKGFKNHEFDKTYLAVVKGCPKIEKGVFSAYLLKDKEASHVKIFNEKVKDSVPIKTGYEVIEKRDETCVLKVKLYTGKTHQIRAHLAYLGYPVVGDEKYGDTDFNKKSSIKKQQLKSYSLTLKFDEKSPLRYLNGKTFVLEK